MSPWFLVGLAAGFEVLWAASLKATEGFTRPLPTLFTVACMAVSMILLARASQQLPIGTAYAVWVGLGAAGTVLAGALWWGEPLQASRLLWLALLIASIIGLRLTEGAAEAAPHGSGTQTPSTTSSGSQ